MQPNTHSFLFSPPENILPLTSRRVHLRRLYDILHLSIQRGDLHRARRAWAILARCKEIDWKTSWMLAIGLLDRSGYGTESNQTKIDYLRTMMLHFSEDREPILCELVHLYVLAGRHREALDELELFELQVLHCGSLLIYLDTSCLPSFPYRDNAVLHIYAGICSVLTSQPGSTSEGDVQSVDSKMLDRAQIFFERAKSLDPENIVVDSLLGMVRALFRDVL
ncbi:hypothetical protein J3R83DRAFT_919 [Lanmaoa asiatica]|nr:hypothetical protein J3R83DRAFT_919 [Lanmaoa asiatica]